MYSLSESTNKEDCFSKRSFPVKIITTSLFCTILIFLFFFWSVWGTYERSFSFSRDFQLQNLSEKIIYLDEVLTMSAFMAASTGDLKWEKRYTSFKPELDEVIQETKRLVPAVFFNDIAEKTEKANIKLVIMETQAFDLVRNGALESALTIMKSNKYELQKSIYKEGIVHVRDELIKQALLRQEMAKSRLFYSIGVFGFFFICFLSMWLMTIKTVKGHLLKRRKAEEALLELNNELEERVKNRTIDFAKANTELKDITTNLVQSGKFAAIRDLAAGVAHELNQPLNGIKIISQSLLRDISYNRIDEKEFKEDLEETIFQVDKMADIISHMKLFSRNTTDEPFELIDVNSIVQGPLKILSTQIRSKDIDLSVEFSPDLPMINGSAVRLEQVVMNLITNARNALEGSNREGKKIVLKTYLSHEKPALKKQINQHFIVIEAQDNGDGIPASMHTKIFNPFFTTNDPGKGTGLGLAVVSKIIKEHDGRIEVESTPGELTSFSIFLPLQDQEEKK